jgi:ABC-type cobalamin/Fe3+-siderophores transport system ATPase subunit
MLYSQRPLDTLSGGEKVKLQMLRLLACEPDVLLLTSRRTTSTSICWAGWRAL